MLYRIFKLLSRFMVTIFYRQIHVENEDRVPKAGPVILAANHPNTLMDPLLVGLLSGRNPHFLGKSTLFNSGLAKWFFKSMNVLPVYRKADAQKEMGKNAQVFEKCYEALEAGNALIIMPEGISQMDGTLHEIKTGTARIGLGTEVRNAFKLGVQIVPAGINYSSPTEFFSDVHCRFGRPIDLRDYADLYAKDEYETVYEVTNQIRDALAKLTTTVEKSESAGVLKNLKKIYKMELAVDLGLDNDLKQHDFSMTRGMADAINWYATEHPELFEQMDKRMTHYLAKVEGLELRDELLSTAQGHKTISRRIVGLIGVLLGFPVYIWGVVNNFLPYRIPANLVRILGTSLEYLSTIKMISGFVVFALFYTLQSGVVWYLTESTLITSLYVISLLPAGRFARFYHDTMQRYRQHIRIFTLFLKRKTLMYEIIEERIALISAIDEAKQEYMNRVEDKSGSNIEDDTRA